MGDDKPFTDEQIRSLAESVPLHANGLPRLTPVAAPDSEEEAAWELRRRLYATAVRSGFSPKLMLRVLVRMVAEMAVLTGMRGHAMTRFVGVDGMACMLYAKAVRADLARLLTTAMKIGESDT